MVEIDESTGLEVLEKQPWEERIFNLDFRGKLASGVSLSSVVSITFESLALVSGSVDPTVTGEAVSGTQAQATYIGGTDGEEYKVTIRCTCSDGEKMEAEGILRVRDS